MVALFTFSGMQAQTTNDEALIGRARGDAKECIKPYASTHEINGTVLTTDECGYAVSFTAGPRCTGTGPCPFFFILISTVTYDCDGNLVSVECY